MEDKETTKKLKPEDIKALISEGDNFAKLPTIDIMGFKLDIESLIVVIIALIAWVFLWGAFDIFGAVSYGNVFFVLYIAISIFNLINSATDVPDVESERLQQSTQQSFIQGGIAVFILAFVFLYNMELDPVYRSQVYRILILCLMVSCLAILIINVKNNSVNIRFIRKMQQMLYNQGLILFLLAL